MIRIDRSGAGSAGCMVFSYRRVNPWLMVAHAVRPCWRKNLIAFLWWGPSINGRLLPPGQWSF